MVQCWVSTVTGLLRSNIKLHYHGFITFLVRQRSSVGRGARLVIERLLASSSILELGVETLLCPWERHFTPISLARSWRALAPSCPPVVVAPHRLRTANRGWPANKVYHVLEWQTRDGAPRSQIEKSSLYEIYIYIINVVFHIYAIFSVDNVNITF